MRIRDLCHSPARRTAEARMVDDGRQARLAVLIDADNASAKIVEGLFEEIAKLGDASVRRIYGDFSSPRIKPWADVLTRFAIQPQQQFAYVTGKNASDIALVIDAMDLLHRERFDGFCLVSSDSDFTRLAARIREEGVAVYGVGERKTPGSFVNACTRFIYSENLMPGAATGEAPTAAAPLEPLSAAEKLLRPIIAEMEDEAGWVGLAELGQRLTSIAPDFDPRTYGNKKLSDLVRKIGTLELAEEGGRLRVRAKAAGRRK